MNDNKRRKALKALAVGAPTAWAKPIVDNVVLPVHALTTCTPDTIPAKTVICGDANVDLFYAIRSSESPCGYDLSFSSSPPVAPYVHVEIVGQGGFAAIDVISVDVDNSTIGNRYVFLNCSNDENDAGLFPLTARDEAGTTYNLNGQFSADVSGKSVSMSELTIAPA